MKRMCEWVQKLASKEVLRSSPTFGKKSKLQVTLHVRLRQVIGLDLVFVSDR